jgi:zinc protease
VSLTFSPLAGVSSHRLSNGLQVYLKPDRRSPLVSVQSWVRVGSIDETPSEAGLSHVLEHMVFKGTTHHKAAEISRWVEVLGGSLNAETSKEYTHYYIDVPTHGAPQAVALMGELLHGATLESAEWARECQVILEEIKRRNDDPEVVLWDLFNESVFAEERLHRPVIGSPATVRALSAGEVQDFYRRHYTAARSLVVVAGDFDRRAMLRWIEKAFKKMPRAGAARRPLPALAPARPQHRSLRRPVKQVYAALGFPTPPSQHPDHEALDLLAAILGEGRCARLVDTLREKKKLVWSVSAANLTHEGPGLFAIFIDCEFAKRAAAFKTLENQIAKLRRDPPSESEMERAKNLLQTAWLQGFETYHNQAATLGSFALDGHLQRLANYLPRLLSLRRSQLIKVIKRYLSTPVFSTAFIEA